MLPSPTLPPAALQALQSAHAGPVGAASAAKPDAARETALDFEAVFLSAMFKQMFSGLDTHGPFGGGYGEEVFREMLADEYARDVAHTGGIGIADQVYREILALQEIENR